MIRAYLDAAPTIYRVEAREPWAGRIEAVISTVSDLTLVASELTRLECLVLPVRTADTLLQQRYERLFDRMTLLPMTRAVFERATDLRATHSLKTPDALHLACAIENGCDEFWTNDERLAAAVPADFFVRVFADAVDALADTADT